MRVSTELIFSQGTQALTERQSELLRTQEQVATGKRVLRPSDDPIAAARINELTQSVDQVVRFQTNADLAEGRIQHEETVLEGFSNSLARVRELALRANSGINDDQARRAIAAELNERLDEMLELANTRDANGDYMFSGYRVDSPAVSHDGIGGFSYEGDQGQRELQIGASRFVEQGDPGAKLFFGLPTGNGVFRTAAADTNAGTGVISVGSVVDQSRYDDQDLRVVFTSDTEYDVIDETDPLAPVTLVSGASYSPGADLAGMEPLGLQASISGAPAAGDEFTVQPSGRESVFEMVYGLADLLSGSLEGEQGQARVAQEVGQAIAGLDVAAERLLTTRSVLGARLNAVDSQRAENENQIIELKSTRSRTEDVDMAEAITRLNREVLGLEAASKSFAKLQGLSLFNYL